MEFKDMPREELVSLWEKTEGGTLPSNRSKNSPLDSFYPITDYLVLFDDDNIVGAVGYSKKEDFTLRGGTFVSPKYQGKGFYKKLTEEGDNKLPKPYFAGFSSSTMSNEDWIRINEGKGWTMNPTDEQLGRYGNNSTVEGFRNYYSNHPKGATWGVKGLPISKWFYVLKVEK